ncbi:MAG: glycerol-3-phosphate 1-O-acyltransferase PlsY [Armatimonadetes bacterium]|nr:glycerol-3-phosphate 1-O-acyltransferase PlsY [Armatimonadota bacterium]
MTLGLGLFLMSAYLLGSIPFGFLVGRTRGVDVTKHGSGNIGFSNVLRLLGPGPASIVLLTDLLKGAVPVFLGRLWLPSLTEADPALWLLAVAVAPVFGHTFSIFLRFRGGRAVATTLGALLGMNWLAGLLGLGVWMAVVAVTRYISVGSIAACCVVPIFMALTGVRFEWTLFWTAVASLIILRHVPNIGRLLEGTESKIGQRVSTE